MNADIGLRPLTVDDAEAMTTVLADPSLYEFTGGKPPTSDELRRRYAVQTRGYSSDGREEWINLIVTLKPEGEPIGYVQATVPRDGGPAEIAWVIGRPWQGNSHATRAGRLLIAHLEERGVADMAAHIHPTHESSKRVASALGFAPTDIVVDGEIRWIRLCDKASAPAGSVVGGGD